MKALILSDLETLEIKEVPDPKYQDHEVLIKSVAVGICGTDFHIFSGKANYHLDAYGQPIPLTKSYQILGHELVGKVEAMGTKVKNLSIGDYVVVDQGKNCYTHDKNHLCSYCLTGDSHQCELYQELGVTGVPGGLADYLSIAGVNAIPIRSSLDKKEAALAEPIGCIIHALEKAENSRSRYQLKTIDTLNKVKSILIFCAGPAGLIFIQCLRNFLGFDGLLLVSEPEQKKREIAAQYGAEVIDPNNNNLQEVIKNKTRGQGIEYVIDACGYGAIFQGLSNIMRSQGTFLLYGYGHNGVDLSVLNQLQFKEINLVCATGASGGFDQQKRPLTYQQALTLLEEKKIDVKSWITHQYSSLEKVPLAFTIERHHSDYIKGVALLE